MHPIQHNEPFSMRRVLFFILHSHLPVLAFPQLLARRTLLTAHHPVRLLHSDRQSLTSSLAPHPVGFGLPWAAAVEAGDSAEFAGSPHPHFVPA